VFSLFSGVTPGARHASITTNSNLVRLPGPPSAPSVIPPVTYCDLPNLFGGACTWALRPAAYRGQPVGIQPVSGGLTDDDAREVT
jgi:hypothetical protein